MIKKEWFLSPPNVNIDVGEIIAVLLLWLLCQNDVGKEKSFRMIWDRTERRNPFCSVYLVKKCFAMDES